MTYAGLHHEKSSRRLTITLWLSAWLFSFATITGSAHAQIALPIAGSINTVAGNAIAGYSGDGGLATSAELSNPTGVAVDTIGNIYIADSANNRIRMVTASTGVITTVAGNGTAGYNNSDGVAATSANLNSPHGVAVDTAGNIYIADTGNHRIRKVTVTTEINSGVTPGYIYTVAGNGTAGSTGNGGAATSAMLNSPYGVAVDTGGNIYIADTNNYRIRKVTVSSGVISTVAGNGTVGFTGDGGLATNAELHIPYGVAVDSVGNIYIADLYNQRIRKVTAATGNISTVAGNGTVGSNGDSGPATSANLFNPYGVAVDSAGNIYIADRYNQRIRKVTAATGNISTAAGTGTAGYNGDGIATSATLNYPYGVAADTAGNIYIADTANQRIRAVGQLPMPHIASIWPPSAVVGTSLTITGTNFGSTQGTSTVTFNGTPGAPTAWSAYSASPYPNVDQIVVPVPAGATGGNVVVTVNGVASIGVPFTVLPTAPSSPACYDDGIGCGTPQLGAVAMGLFTNFLPVQTAASMYTNVQQAGLKVDRIGLYWDCFMDANGNYSPHNSNNPKYCSLTPSQIQAVIAGDIANGVTPEVLLGTEGPNYMPCVNCAGNSSGLGALASYADLTTAYNDLANILSNLVAAYPNVKYWELFNEMDAPGFSPLFLGPSGTCPGVRGQTYGTMLNAVVPSAKQVNPNIHILMGGMVGAVDVLANPSSFPACPSYGDLAQTMKDFVTGIYNAGAGSNFDIVNAHANGIDIDPRFVTISGDLRQAVSVQHDASKQFWITEFGSGGAEAVGYGTCSPNSTPDPFGHCMDQEQVDVLGPVVNDLLQPNATSPLFDVAIIYAMPAGAGGTDHVPFSDTSYPMGYTNDDYGYQLVRSDNRTLRPMFSWLIQRNDCLSQGGTSFTTDGVCHF